MSRLWVCFSFLAECRQSQSLAVMSENNLESQDRYCPGREAEAGEPSQRGDLAHSQGQAKGAGSRGAGSRERTSREHVAIRRAGRTVSAAGTFRAPMLPPLSLLRRSPLPAPRARRPWPKWPSGWPPARAARCWSHNRTQTVFGVGNPHAKLVFIGEAPGADEDRQGEPFVGRAGQLLTDIITKGMKLRREDVYIMNILRCRPPDNRTPLPLEAANCREYLDAQLAIIQPQFLCCLGLVPRRTCWRSIRPSASSAAA